ncbi:hypothetical protein V5E97_05730 [Singulisphaera sp. Ch08]|uniref:Transposase n=1 Tax=Singulisphaera sp. Ch08 TaxID=3120278 RepID=A0AAU7CKJ1_9BACT
MPHSFCGVADTGRSQDVPPTAKLVDVGSIASDFESLSDPRHTRNRKHFMVDIAGIAFR